MDRGVRVGALHILNVLHHGAKRLVFTSVSCDVLCQSDFTHNCKKVAVIAYC